MISGRGQPREGSVRRNSRMAFSFMMRERPRARARGKRDRGGARSFLLVAGTLGGHPEPVLRADVLEVRVLIVALHCIPETAGSRVRVRDIERTGGIDRVEPLSRVEPDVCTP